MSGWTKANLAREVDDMAPRFGYGEMGEARFARGSLELEATGVSYQALRPGVRQAFGHRHAEQEEVYVVVSGSGRVKLDDEIVEVEALDALRVAPQVARQFEAGADGLAYVVFGPGSSNDAELLPDWWAD